MSYLLPNSRTGCMAFATSSSHPTVAPHHSRVPATPITDHKSQIINQGAPAVFLSRENTIETTTSTVPSARNDTTR